MTASPQRDPAGDARPVLVIAAMAEEIAPLCARAETDRVMRIGSCRVQHGRLGGEAVILARTGEGRTRAERGAAALLDRFDPKLLVVVGIAGGLSPDLDAGDVVVAREVRDGGGPFRAPDPGWIGRALRDGRAVAGTVISTSEILGTPAEKAAARAGLPTDEPATVDLESAAFARAAAARNIPYVVLRAVSDTADERLPLDFNACRDQAGGIRRMAVVRRALLHPASVRGLWRLRRRLGRCADELADLTEKLFDGEAT
jgi:adenosylhomocysteine nucleosidase